MTPSRKWPYFTAFQCFGETLLYEKDSSISNWRPCYLKQALLTRTGGGGGGGKIKST